MIWCVMPWSGGDRLCPGDGSPGLQGLPAADVTRSMYLGEGKFEGKAHPKLRIVTSLYPEDLHLVLSVRLTGFS